MSLFHITCGMVGLEIILLLIWIYSIFRPGSGTDPAGAGMAQAFILGLMLYIVVQGALLYVRTRWGIGVAFVMALVPLVVTLYGLIRWLSTR